MRIVSLILRQQLLHCFPLIVVKALHQAKIVRKRIFKLHSVSISSFSASAAAGLEDSEILKGDASYQSALANFLKPVMQSNSQWKRCWRASLDGWAASTFHSLCDDKGPTVTIVRVGQYIFGGYTSISWSK